MVFIWRGAGIIIPIIFGISAWLTSYSFDDTRFGNNVYMGWSMLWASIPLLLLGLAFAGANLADAETGEKPPKSHNDFFFIPVWVWGLGLMSLGIYWINKEPSLGYNYSNETDNELVSTDENDENSDQIRRIHLYNPYSDTLKIEIDYPSGEGIIDTYVPAGSSQYADLSPGKYTTMNNGRKGNIDVKSSSIQEARGYDDGWLIVGGGYDLITLNVTDVCNDTIKKSDIRNINWTERVWERLSSDGIMTSYLDKSPKQKQSVIGAGRALPLNHEKGEMIFTFIPIKSDLKTTEEHLDSMVINVCF